MGYDVPQDLRLALKLFKRASLSREYDVLRDYVGVCYLNGLGCKQDLGLSARYFADESRDTCDDLYEQGRVGEQRWNYAEAKKMYLAAIMCGNLKAARRLQQNVKQGKVVLVNHEFAGEKNFLNLCPA